MPETHVLPLIRSIHATARRDIETIVSAHRHLVVVDHRRVRSLLPRELPEPLDQLQFSDYVDLAIVARDPSSNRLRTLITVDVRDDPLRAAAKARALAQADISHINLRPDPHSRRLIDESGSDSRWRKEIKAQVIRSTQPSTWRRWAFSDAAWEGDVAHDVRRHIDPSKLAYLEQVRLSEVIALSDEDERLLRERIREANHQLARNDKISERKFFYNTDVDGVVCTSPPFSIPLALVEIDGNVHRTQAGKRQRDKLKNRLARAANIPLVRLAHGPGVEVYDTRNAIRALRAIASTTTGTRVDQLPGLLANLDKKLAEMSWPDREDIGSNVELILSSYRRLVGDLAQQLSLQVVSTLPEKEGPAHREEIYPEYDEAAAAEMLEALHEGRELCKFYRIDVSAKMTTDGSHISASAEPWGGIPVWIALPVFPELTLALPALRVAVPESRRRELGRAVANEFRADIGDLVRERLAVWQGTPAAKAALVELQERPVRMEEERLAASLMATGGDETKATRVIRRWIGAPREAFGFNPAGDTPDNARRRLADRLHARLARAIEVLRSQNLVAEDFVLLIREDLEGELRAKVETLEARPVTNVRDVVESMDW